MSPRYSAKEIASYLGKQHNVPVVLGSATPDMTTYHDAINGKKELLELTKRANNASLPDIEIVDLRHELASGNKTMVSQKLHDEIEENLKNITSVTDHLKKEKHRSRSWRFCWEIWAWKLQTLCRQDSIVTVQKNV